jgi:hypothetical protein
MAALIPLGGIKFSEELVLLRLSADGPPRGGEVDVLRALAGREINLFYLSVCRSAAATRVDLCVGADRGGMAGSLAAQESWCCQTVAAVGLLSIYPHARRLEALTRSLAAFSASGLPVLGVASTLSALTLVTAFAELERAGECLREVFSLPRNHAPFAAEFRVKPVTR